MLRVKGYLDGASVSSKTLQGAFMLTSGTNAAQNPAISYNIWVKWE